MNFFKRSNKSPTRTLDKTIMDGTLSLLHISPSWSYQNSWGHLEVINIYIKVAKLIQQNNLLHEGLLEGPISICASRSRVQFTCESMNIWHTYSSSLWHDWRSHCHHSCLLWSRYCVPNKKERIEQLLHEGSLLTTMHDNSTCSLIIQIKTSIQFSAI